MAKAAGTKFDLYKTITDAIVEALEKGAANFEMPWHQNFESPVNASTGKFYRGLNVVALWAAAYVKNYSTPYWATFKQWQELGANVKKGEKSTLGMYFSTIDKVVTDASGNHEVDSYFLVKPFFLFNADQVEGWEKPAAPLLNEAKTLAHVDAFVKQTLADIRSIDDRAYYSPLLDFINMPAKKLFKKTKTSTATEAYYATMLHELVHWTGAKKRLDRLPLMARQGGEEYAFEELVAELGSAFLCAELGVSNEFRQDHANYIGHWIKVLKNDKRAIFKAAKLGQQATNYLKEFQTAVSDNSLAA
jgi:hypothetical protein